MSTCIYERTICRLSTTLRGLLHRKNIIFQGIHSRQLLRYRRCVQQHEIRSIYNGIDWLSSMLAQINVTSTLGNSTRCALAKRGLPQGGVIYPLLWNLVVDEILKDDIVKIASGKFPDIISDIMQRALNTLPHWAPRCGLNINPLKAELVPLHESVTYFNVHLVCKAVD